MMSDDTWFVLLGFFNVFFAPFDIQSVCKLLPSIVLVFTTTKNVICTEGDCIDQLPYLKAN